MLTVTALPLGELRTNCYIVSLPGASEVVLIDPGDGASALRAALGARTVAGVLLTHAHCDHIAGLSALPGVPVYVHADDAGMMTDPALNCCDTLRLPPPSRAADRLLQEGDHVRLAGIQFTVLHTPGHTPGSVCYQAQDCLFTGDTLFTGGYGRTDLPGGDWHRLRVSLRRLMRMTEDFRVLPGHGGETTLRFARGRA